MVTSSYEFVTDPRGKAMRKSIGTLAALALIAGVFIGSSGAATKKKAKPVAKAKATTSRASTLPATTAAPTTQSPTTAAPTTAAAPAAAGCAKGWTDPGPLDPSRAVARCDKGFPAAKPLAQKTKVRIATAFRLEFNSPLLLADSLGEFAKENVEVEFVPLSFANSVPQLANGSIDMAVGGFEIALFNAGNNNLPVKAVMGNYFPPKAGDYKTPQTGLWCRRDAFADPKNPNPSDTEVMKWATSVGKGSVSVYYSAAELQRRIPGFQIKRVEIAVVPSADTVTALKNKAIECGVLLDPLWLQVKDDPAFIQMATQTPGEPLGQYAFGKSLLVDHPEVGDAVVRAVLRSVNTYFAGDYHEDPKVLTEISRVTNQPAPNLKSVDSLTMDWEIRSGTTTRVQQLFIDLGVITDFKTPIAEDKVVDRSFYERAVGHRK